MSKFEINFLGEYSEEAILDELRRVAKATDSETVSKSDIENYGKVSYSLINKRFGSLRRALQKAGLKPTRYMNASDEEMLAILIDLWELVLEKDGRTPQRKDLKAYGFTISGDTYTRRFGSWKKALVQAYDSVTDEKKASPIEVQPSKQRKSRNVLSLRKRFFVLKRDEFTCKMCGACGPGVRLEVDHVVPFSQGGTDELSNLQTLCFNCNRGKRDSH